MSSATINTHIYYETKIIFFPYWLEYSLTTNTNFHTSEFANILAFFIKGGERRRRRKN